MHYETGFTWKQVHTSQIVLKAERSGLNLRKERGGEGGSTMRRLMTSHLKLFHS